MKVLSIKEPFASLIKDNKKRIETRSWKTKYRGPIYIHASITPHKKDERINKLLKLVNPMYGFIICKCNLVNVRLIDEEFIKTLSKDEIYYGNYEFGRYAWILEDVKILNNPIKAKGKLSIWNYDGGINE